MTALRQPTKYRFATCCGMAQQPSTDGHLGIPRNSYQVPWFGCPDKSVLGCFVKSFPIVGLVETNKRERKNTKDSAAQPTANNSNHQHHVFGNRLHVHRHREMERTDERRKESQLSPSGQENQERTPETLCQSLTRRIQPLVWPVPTDTHTLHPGA